MRIPFAVGAAAVSFCLSCGGALIEPEQQFGSLLVSISTGGNTLDEDGYHLIVADRRAITVGLNTTLTIPDLAAGSHFVRLEGIAAQCDVAVGRVRSVQIERDSTTPLDFRVVCSSSCDDYWSCLLQVLPHAGRPLGARRVGMHGDTQQHE